MAQTLADYLRTRHIRPSELARDAGLKYSSTIANWMNGTVRAPYGPNIKKVADALHVSTDELFALIEESYKRAHSDPPDLAPAA